MSWLGLDLDKFFTSVAVRTAANRTLLMSSRVGSLDGPAGLFFQGRQLRFWPVSPPPYLSLSYLPSISQGRFSHLSTTSPRHFMRWLRAELPSHFKVMAHTENIQLAEKSTSCPRTMGPLRAEDSTSQHTWGPFRTCEQQNGGDSLLMHSGSFLLTHGIHYQGDG